MNKMEGDSLLFEDACAYVSTKVRPEDVGAPGHSMSHSAQDLNGEVQKGVSSLYDNLCKSEAAELQKERTSVTHSPNRSRKVED
jgi:hypothetical protein